MTGVQTCALPISKDRLEEYYASYVADLFRSLRFGTGEAHGRAEMMELNYLLEGRAVTHASGRYIIDYARVPAVVAALAKELLTIEATGDRARGEALLAKYDQMPPDLTAALAAAKDIPVDIEPVFSFSR